MATPYILSESTWKTIRSQQYDLAVLPWGATEAHNLHLPYGTDNIETEFIARRSAEKSWKKGVRITVLPVIPFGVNTSQQDIYMTINLNPSTHMKILEDVLVNLMIHKIPKLIIFNGHGGNDFKSIIRELQPKFLDIFIVQVNWYEVVPLNLFFEEGGDHANEMETSVMMHIVPQLVLPLTEAGSGKAKQAKFTAKKEGWAWFPRAWTKVTADTGIGNPAKASAEKGFRYLEAITDKIADFFEELVQTETEDIYE
jgi:creatinine amidohydrolase